MVSRVAHRLAINSRPSTVTSLRCMFLSKTGRKDITLSLFDRFRKKDATPPHREPVLPPPVAAPAKPIAEMSLHEVIATIQAHPGTAPFAVVRDAFRRFYTIACFDHGVPDVDRATAMKLAAALKGDIESLLSSKPDALAAFCKAVDFEREAAAKAGVGSLVWLIDEHEIPGEDIIPFIMKPENGHKLAEYLSIIPPATIEGTRFHMVRELVMQRSATMYPNTVLHIHGLVSSGDPAAFALFKANEIEAFLRVPHGYAAARKTLVSLGLLALESGALPLSPPPPDELLTFIVSQTAIDCFRESDPENKLNKPEFPEEMEGLDTIIPVAVCIHLGLSMIDTLYGPEKRNVALGGVRSQFSRAYEGLSDLVDLQSSYENFGIETLLHEDGNREASLDYMMVFAAIEKFQLQQSEEEFNRTQPYVQFLTRQLAHIRPAYLIKLRYNLRFFIHDKRASVAPSLQSEEVRRRIMELYAEYGARAGVIEAASFGEDWIGTKA